MNFGLAAMEKPQDATSTKRVYFVMNSTSGVWVKVSDEYCRLSDAAKALEQLITSYPFARLGGVTIS
jgi:hypothetical protein